MRSARYVPTSALAISLLAEAAEFIRDFEGDMIVEFAQQIKCSTSQKHRDESIADIVDMNRRVRFATNFVTALKSAKVGEELFFDGVGLEVLDRGLEFMQDNLAEMVTEPMWEVTRKTKGQAVISFTQDEFTKLREAVELAIERADTAAALLKEIRSIPR